MRYVELMGYIYIYTQQPPQKTTFLTPPPLEILVVLLNFLAFCLPLVQDMLGSLFYSGIPVKVLRFMLHA